MWVIASEILSVYGTLEHHTRDAISRMLRELVDGFAKFSSDRRYSVCGRLASHVRDKVGVCAWRMS